MHQPRRRNHDLRAKRYDVPPSRRHARSLRLSAATYRRRRITAGAAAVVGVAVLGLGVQAIVSGPGGGPPASAAGAGSLGGERAVRARPGDSLWAIARAHHGDVDFERYLGELIELNGGTAIDVGQQVRLP